MFIPVEVRLACRRGIRHAKTLLFVAAGLSASLAMQSISRRNSPSAAVRVQFRLDVSVQVGPRIFDMTHIFGLSPP